MGGGGLIPLYTLLLTWSLLTCLNQANDHRIDIFRLILSVLDVFINSNKAPFCTNHNTTLSIKQDHHLIVSITVLSVSTDSTDSKIHKCSLNLKL